MSRRPPGPLPSPCDECEAENARLRAEIAGLVELAEGLERRAAECTKLAAANPPKQRGRLEGKQQAYKHAAELLREDLQRRVLTL